MPVRHLNWHGRRLQEAIKELHELESRHWSRLVMQSSGVYKREIRDSIEARRMVILGQTIASTAHIRRGSRDAHARVDHPKRDDAKWLANLVVKKHREGFAISKVPVRLNKRQPEETSREVAVVSILRRDGLQRYQLPYESGKRVLDALDYIYAHLDGSIGFRYHCRAGYSAGCAVEVDGRFVLACTSYMPKGMMIRPLAKSRAVRDLITEVREPSD